MCGPSLAYRNKRPQDVGTANVAPQFDTKARDFLSLQAKGHSSGQFTAKNHIRHTVNHSYHDHACDSPPHSVIKRNKGGVSIPFPIKMHQMLKDVEAKGLTSIVSWQPHGRAFVVHKPQEFLEKILPTYFNQSKLGSFQRQLNLYEFSRITSGKDKGGYYHELFLRAKPFLTDQMTRKKVKGTRVRGISNPKAEPDFYSMPYICENGAIDYSLSQGKQHLTTSEENKSNNCDDIYEFEGNRFYALPLVQIKSNDQVTLKESPHYPPASGSSSLCGINSASEETIQGNITVDEDMVDIIDYLVDQHNPF